MPLRYIKLTLKTLMKIFCSFCLILFTSACNTPYKNSFIRQSVEKVAILPAQQLHVKTTFQNDVAFMGQYNYDDIDLKGGNVMYPGDSGGVFLAAIFAHAVTADSIKNNEMNQAQEQANIVLKPYSKYLREFENEELVSCVINELNNNYDFQVTKFESNNKQLSGWVLRSEPVFYMTQDQRELVLKHAMYVHRANKPDEISHKNIIEISSKRTTNNDLFDFWINNNNLPKISAEMYAKSVALFINDMIDDSDNATRAKQQTFRYKQGGEKKYERGTLVKNECGRTTIRTLRGWLKSFPNDIDASSKADNDCTDKAYVDHQMLIDLSKIQ